MLFIPAEDLDRERPVVRMRLDQIQRMAVVRDELCRVDEIGRRETESAEFSQRATKRQMRVARERREAIARRKKTPADHEGRVGGRGGEIG